MEGKSFNGLDPAQAEVLALLAEELGEAQQAIGKILRHGLESHNPDEVDGPSNKKRLSSELGDISAAVEIAACIGVVSNRELFDAMDRKLRRVSRYLHHIEPIGESMPTLRWRRKDPA